MMVEVLNLFFIPTISLFIFYKFVWKDKLDKIEVLLSYTLSSVVVFLLSKAICYLVAWLFRTVIYVSSMKYCLIAVVVAVAIPFLVKFFELKVITKSYKKEEKINEEQEKEEK